MRLSDSLAQPGAGAGAFSNATMVNALTGGYHGIAANLARHVDNAGFRQQQLQCVVLRTPGAIKHLDHPEVWHGHIKAMMEKHTRSITGFQRALQADHFSQPAGGSGAEHFDLANVTQQQPTPTHEIGEKYGFPNGTLLEWWMRLFMMDPDVKRPLIMTYPNPPKDLLPDMTSMICLYYDTDPTGQEIINAYLCVGMQPKSSGTRESRYDKSQGSSDLVHSIEFTSTAIMNAAVDKLAEKINKTRSLIGANPYNRDLPDVLKVVGPDVNAAKSGVVDDINDMRAHQVQM